MHRVEPLIRKDQSGGLLLTKEALEAERGLVVDSVDLDLHTVGVELVRHRVD